MVSAALRALLQQAPGAGELTGPDVLRARAEHAVCGDEVELFVRVDGETVTEFAWQARGCPACVAVVASARDAVVGTPIGEAKARVAQRVASLGGLLATEQHALKLVGEALASLRGRA